MCPIPRAPVGQTAEVKIVLLDTVSQGFGPPGLSIFGANLKVNSVKRLLYILVSIEKIIIIIINIILHSDRFPPKNLHTQCMIRIFC